MFRATDEVYGALVMSEHDAVAVGDLVTTDNTATFLDGSQRSVAFVGPTWVGRGTYLPGWRWSTHVKPLHDKQSEAHAGYVLSGEMAVRGSDGTEVIAGQGQAFYAAPGHDA